MLSKIALISLLAFACAPVRTPVNPPDEWMSPDVTMERQGDGFRHLLIRNKVELEVMVSVLCYDLEVQSIYGIRVPPNDTVTFIKNQSSSCLLTGWRVLK